MPSKARSDPQRRRTALRYAVGIGLLQLAWVGRLVLPGGWRLPAFFVIALAELLLPFWARRPSPITWHPRYIAERFGLFTIIVLGEAVLAASLAVQVALDAGKALSGLLSLAGAGVVIVFAMWWLYFDLPVHHLPTSPQVALLWGYGQYWIFAAAAAVGAALAVAVDYQTGAAHLGRVAVGYAMAVPVAVYLLAVWALHIRPYHRGLITSAFWGAAVLTLLSPFTPAPVHAIAVLLATLVATIAIAPRRSGDLPQTATGNV